MPSDGALPSSGPHHEKEGCVMGHDWCNGPDGETARGEAFGGLCGDCWIRRAKKEAQDDGE